MLITDVIMCVTDVTDVIFTNNFSPWLAGSKTAERAECQADRAPLHFCVIGGSLKPSPCVYLYETLTEARVTTVS